MARGRKPGFVMSDEHRVKIQNSNILNALIEHVQGQREMSATQVSAGLGLLKKVMPDLVGRREHHGSRSQVRRSPASEGQEYRRMAASSTRNRIRFSKLGSSVGPQSALISCPVFEVFFGGARGGGKTDGVLGDFLEHADTYGEHAIGLMLRRQRTELVETIERSRKIYGPLGWKFHEQDKMWRAPDGARLRFAYLERDADAEAYQGHSYTRLYVEEIGNFPSDKPILKLMATLRSGAGVPVGFRATGNPGGPGHQWVRRDTLILLPMGFRVFKDAVSGLERVYIPSRVGTTSFLGDDYVQQLKASGSRRTRSKHGLRVIGRSSRARSSIAGKLLAMSSSRSPYRTDWARFRSGDWGSAKPFSIGWWAVVGTRQDADSGLWLPRGCLVRYREWYGCSRESQTG
jgi:hypothetical protein